MIKKVLGLEKASGTAGRETIAVLTKNQAEEIAKEKMDDLNTKDLKMAVKIVAGTARSMGIKVDKQSL